MSSSSESLSSEDTTSSSSESLSSETDEERQENPVPKKSEDQELAESWRTIEQIKRLDRREYDEDTMFLCRVSLKDIDCSRGWCYLGCDTCQKSMYGAPRKYKCSRCGPIKRPIQWYKLDVKVQDATGTMKLMIFCEVAEELVGVSAEELVDKIKDDDEWYTLPDEIEDLLGSTHTFQVFDKYRNGSFSVYSIMDHLSIPAPAATTNQCKEDHGPNGSVNTAVPTTTSQCNTMSSSSEPLSSEDTLSSSSESLSSDNNEERPENLVPKKSAAQKLAKSWRTIKQIKSLDRKEYDEDTMFLCRVSLKDIDCSSGWCYLGCDTCQKSMYGAPGKYKCSRCGPIKRPIQWYKLDAKVQDATGTMKLMIFCEVAEKLVGVSAEELVDKIKHDDEWYTLPDEIEDLLGSTHTFQVFDKYMSGSFSVNAIKDHVSVPAPAATTAQCKEEGGPKGSSTNMAVPTTATNQCKKRRAHEDSSTMAEARSKSTRLLKPNKRLRGDDWIN